MRKVRFEELVKMPAAGQKINWILPWHMESLHSCFRFLALELEPFEKFNSDGGASLLAEGSGSVDGKAVKEGDSFGIERIMDASEAAPAASDQAESESDGKKSGSGSGTGRILKTSENGEERMIRVVPQWFKAETPCVVLCFNTNIFHNVCFGMGCGSMHARIREMILKGI